MEKTEKNARHTKLATVSMIRTLLLIAALIISISICVNYVLQKEILKTYTDFSFSYARMIAKDIDGDAVNRYVKSGETDAYYDEIQRVMQGMVDSAELRYLYVVIPQDEGLLYVWDAQLDHEPRPLLDIWEYSGNYPSDKAKLAYTTGEEWFYTYQYHNMDIVSAITPVFDSSGKAAAIVEADILMPRIRTATRTAMIHVILSVALVMLVLALAHFLFFVRKRFIIPLEKIHNATANIVDYLDKEETVAIDIHSGDEIEQIARSFEEMNRKLLDYIRENSRITADKAKQKCLLYCRAEFRGSYWQK